ncbi:MAG TPA: Mov34/MPN/PAD-1 family protein [Candidatus Acidoferrum sp.]|nr:Mov34/MPN/PAD-1 family protein [Candidatus Acidoferrum sp.]
MAVWTTDPEFNTRLFRRAAVPVQERQIGSWRLVTDDSFILSVRRDRRRKLPRETGGVLLGSWDLVRGIVYVVASIAAPDDSEEWPTSYIRGAGGLEATVRAATMRTGSQLQYIGEWHSHPDEHTAEPSEDDLKLFSWLQEYLRQDGYAPVMLIVAETELGWYVGTV